MADNIDMFDMIEKVKKHPDFKKAGMLLMHNGVVRNTSKDGNEISELKVKVDHKKLNEIIEKYKKKQGIIEIVIKIVEDKTLYVGDDVMCLIVAGDERNNVISTLSDTLNEIKTKATFKTEVRK